MVERYLQDGSGPEANEQVDVNKMHAPLLREADEPIDGYKPVPMLWFMLTLALTMWGGWYLGQFGANFSPNNFDGSALETTQVQKVVSATLTPMQIGKRVFNNCMACHQQDGKGIAGQFPPLAGSEWVLGSPNILARILLHGMHEPVVVLKETYHGVMPAWQRLDDSQIAGVLTYIRASWGNQASAVDAELIAQERKLSAGRSVAWTATELTAKP